MRRRTQLSAAEARRIALAAQGFARPAPTGKVDARSLRSRVLDHVALLQIDSVNVLDRAHYLTLWSRFGPYERVRLDRLVYRRRLLFEYWAHAACLVPASHLALLDATDLPALPTWPRVYAFVLGTFVLWVILLTILSRAYS